MWSVAAPPSEIDARWRVALAAWRPAGVLAAVDRRRVALVGDDRRARPLDDRREAAGVVAVLVGHQHRRHVVEGKARCLEALGELIDGGGEAPIEHQESAFGLDRGRVERHLAILERDTERECVNVVGKVYQPHVGARP